MKTDRTTDSAAAERIRRAAIEAFAESGYGGTSTRQIAKRLNMSATAMYPHYRSKEELLYAIALEGHGSLLATLRHAAEHSGHAHADGVGKHLHGLGDLGDEFACGGEHDAAGPVRASFLVDVGRKVCDERDREGDCLAAAGAPAPEHVAALQRVRQRVALNGKRCALAVLLEGVSEGCGHAEIGE